MRSVLLFLVSVNAAAADLQATVRDQGGRPVADAVVIAVPEAGLPKPAARGRVEQVEQIDQEFVPRVKVVLVGSGVSFPNRHAVRHHVYSFSPAKRFDLPLYAAPATRRSPTSSSRGWTS